jgi:lipoprotein-releasing system ATP-binding protein
MNRYGQKKELKKSNMLLSVKDISKSYKSGGNTKVRTVLDGISLDIQKGETLSILGPSGSGKSTLLNILGTLDKPDSGDILFDGQSLMDMRDVDLTRFRNREIGLIFQLHHLLPQCTVLENVLLPVFPVKDKAFRKAREKMASDLIQSVGLWEQKNQKPNILSGGECQRVAVIRALINQPRLLLADEPTGSLDEENAIAIISLLLKLNDQFDTSLVVVTHSREIGRRMDKRYELKNGKLVLQ